MLKHVFSLKYNYLNKDVAFCPHKADKSLQWDCI